MTRATLGAVVCLLAITASSCSFVQHDDRRLYRGHYTWGDETSAYVNCNADEVWWALDPGESDINLVEGYMQVATADFEPVYISLLGTISEAGSYGHLGIYDRELTIERVLTMRKQQDEDCR